MNAGIILKQFYDAVQQRNMALARSYLEDNMTFVGLFETYPNADAYIATFSQLMQIVTRLDVKIIIGEGDNAAVFMEMVTTAPAPATTLVAEWHQTRNGKIVRAQSAFDGRPFAAMFAGTQDAATDELAIRHRVGINVKPERVFAALTTIDGLRGWWVSDTKGNAAVGGMIDFGFCQMQVVEVKSNNLVHWRCVKGPAEWLDTEVTFSLSWKEDQTYVLFSHTKWKEPVEFMHHCSTKWATFLLSLRDLLENSRGRPVPHDLKIHVND